MDEVTPDHQLLVAHKDQNSLFVALMGEPNAGKSTLINQLVGAKISIVTPKVQTTRTNVRGIAMVDQTQLVLIDTPGIFQPKKFLEKSIVKTAWQGIKEAEILVFILDAKKGLTKESEAIIDILKKEARPTVLLINKIDKLPRDQLLPLTQKINQLKAFDQTFMISALNGDGVADLKRYLAEHAKKEPWCFDPKDLSDMPLPIWAAELVREQLFLQLQQELPYHLAVQTEQCKELTKGQIRLDITIYTNKESQKQIILGKQGNRIKQIGIKVRHDLEKTLNKVVHLFLFVKVKENWIENKHMYSQMGMESPD